MSFYKKSRKQSHWQGRSLPLTYPRVSPARMSAFGEGVDLDIVMRTAAPAALLAGCLALLPAPAAAQTKIIDEVKIGGLAHDVTFGGRHVESGADVNIEMLFTPPDMLRV